MINIDNIKDLPGEEWRPIEGYDGSKYLISNYGRCKSLKHANARLLTAFMNNKGYDNLTACLLVFSSETHAVKQVTKQLRYEHKNPETSTVSGFCGGDCWTRTSDLMRVKHAL